MIEGGGEVLSPRVRVNQLPYANGLYVYPTLTAFATDLGGINQRDYTSYTQSVGNPSTRDHRSEGAESICQDTWRPPTPDHNRRRALGSLYAGSAHAINKLL